MRLANFHDAPIKQHGDIFCCVVMMIVALFLLANDLRIFTGFLLGGCAMPEFRIDLAIAGGRIDRPANEFSRSYRVEGILSGSQRQRDYGVKVEATADELARLANRFVVNRMYHLQADVAIRRERLSASSAYPGVEVEGMVTERVVQVCVRTGEIFDVDVQFPLFAVVRKQRSIQICRGRRPGDGRSPGVRERTN